MRREFCPSVSIDASEDEVISATLDQNFVPIVDSRNTMCGIITGRGVIAYLAKKEPIELLAKMFNCSVKEMRKNIHVIPKEKLNEIIQTLRVEEQ